MADNRIAALKEFFADGGYPEVTSRELIDLRKGDPDGYNALMEGISNGSLTY